MEAPYAQIKCTYDADAISFNKPKDKEKEGHPIGYPSALKQAKCSPLITKTYSREKIQAKSQ